MIHFPSRRVRFGLVCVTLGAAACTSGSDPSRPRLDATNDASIAVVAAQTKTTWIAPTTVGSTFTPRENHSVTQYDPTHALIVGGDSFDGSAIYRDAWIFDSVAMTLTSAGTPLVPRYGHAAVALDANHVLIVGGFDGSTNQTCEIWDATTHAFTSTGSTNFDHNPPTVTLLDDGRVFLLGGVNNSGNADEPAEIFSGSSWTIVADSAAVADGGPAYNPAPIGVSFIGGSAGFGLVTLTSGKVFVVAQDPSVTVAPSGALLFDPVALAANENPWTDLGLKGGCGGAGNNLVPTASVRLADGRAFVNGYMTSGDPGTACIFDPATSKFTASGISSPAGYASATLLEDSRNRVLLNNTSVSGGVGFSIYDPTSNAITAFPAMYAQGTTSPQIDTGSLVTAALSGGRALVVGLDATYPVVVLYDDADSAKCTDGSTCSSGTCSDGYCCDRSCVDPCVSCAVAGKLGTCTAVDTPVAGHTPCAPGFTCGGGVATCTVPIDAGTDAAPDMSGADVESTDAGPDTFAPDVASLDAGPDTFAPDVGSLDVGADTFAPDVVSLDVGADTFAPDVGSIDVGADTIAPDVGSLDVGADTFAPDVVSLDAGPDTLGASDVGSEASLAVADVGTTDAAPQIQGGFTRCTSASQCATGFCVDGVCCDSACGGTCQSCALPTSPGKCALVPLGVDPRKTCGGGASCVSTCDGKGACTAASAGTICAISSCTGKSTGEGPIVCSSQGASCPAGGGVPFDCREYVCDSAFGACKSTCTDSNDCADGFTCDTTSNHCVAAAPAAAGGCATRSSTARSPASDVGLLALCAATMLAMGRRRRSIG